MCQAADLSRQWSLRQHLSTQRIHYMVASVCEHVCIRVPSCIVCCCLSMSVCLSVMPVCSTYRSLCQSIHLSVCPLASVCPWHLSEMQGRTHTHTQVTKTVCTQLFLCNKSKCTPQLQLGTGTLYEIATHLTSTETWYHIVISKTQRNNSFRRE